MMHSRKLLFHHPANEHHRKTPLARFVRDRLRRPRRTEDPAQRSEPRSPVLRRKLEPAPFLQRRKRIQLLHQPLRVREWLAFLIHQQRPQLAETRPRSPQPYLEIESV